MVDENPENLKSQIRARIDGSVEYTKKKAENVADGALTAYTTSMGQVILNSLATLLTFVLVVTLSFFLYGTFYYAYVPVEVYEEPMNLQFEPCLNEVGMCSFPNASVAFNKNKLMPGQAYSVSVLLEVPDSVNNQALGMFMSCLMVTKMDNTTHTVCRSSTLEFRSQMLRVMETAVFSPFLLTGTTTQRQWISINFHRKFYDDHKSPTATMTFQIQSKFIQVYSTQLLIHAEFSGLRHIMYYYPLISTCAGVMSNFLLLSTLVLLSWSRFFGLEHVKERTQIQDYTHESGLVGKIIEEDEDEKKDKIFVESVEERETQPEKEVDETIDVSLS